MDAVTPASGDSARRVFRSVNRWFMIPVHRAGLGAWIATPIGGYMLLLRVRGRKTGAIREVPVSYTLAEGSAWIAAGFGSRTQWLHNVEADPDVEVVLPGRAPITAVAVVEPDEAVRQRILPALLRATGAPALMSGANPWAADPGPMLAALPPMPLVRVTPVDGVLEPGPDDPGGGAWAWRQLVVLGLTIGVIRLATRIGRSLRR